MSTAPSWKNFHLAEFACHDGTPVPDTLFANVNSLVRDVLDPVRAEFGHPLVIVSGYRPPEYNKRIGGARFSQHMTAKAADIRPVELRRLSSLKAIIEEMYKDGLLPELGGYGVYSQWIHVDCRKNAGGKLRRWRGSGQGSEVT